VDLKNFLSIFRRTLFENVILPKSKQTKYNLDSKSINDQVYY